MTRNDCFPGTYLGKADVENPIVATVASVRIESIKSEHGNEEKPILVFEDDQLKSMVLNVSNWNALEELYGPESDNWTGKQIEIYVDPNVSFAGKRVGGLRLRKPAGAQSGNDAWSWDFALAEAGKLGITKDQIVNAIKAAGHNGWKPERDTTLVKELIQTAKEAEVVFN